MTAQANDFPPVIFLEALNRIPFFKDFSTYEKRRLCSSHANFVQFIPGEWIIREGDIDSSFYILLDGSVSVMKQHVEIVYMEAGEFFGELAFLGNTARTSSVVAREPVLALRIDRDLMRRLGCETREKIKDQCIFKMVERVDKLTERLRVRM
ncbi:MAG: cyclic nucleotide-binding domain-containing protein [Magnetococcus sp. XQGC-1]